MTPKEQILKNQPASKGKVTDSDRIDFIESVCRQNPPTEPMVACDKWGPTAGQFSIELDTPKRKAKRFKSFRQAIDAALRQSRRGKSQ